MSTLRKLEIPGGTILQSRHAQGASSATEALFKFTLSTLPDTQLRLLEAGSGSGVLAIMLQQARPQWQVTALEIQSHLHELAMQNASSLSLHLDCLNADLRAYTYENKYNCIVANPPWQKLGSGWLSPVPERAVSRSELCCTLQDVLAFCSRNLVSGGQAFLLYPPSRQSELCQALEPQGLAWVGVHPADPGSLIFHIRKG